MILPVSHMIGSNLISNNVFMSGKRNEKLKHCTTKLISKGPSGSSLVRCMTDSPTKVPFIG